MSKKLLMNNYSSSGGGGLQPIQDGLVCWLDAFDLTSYNTGETWNDRSSYGNNGLVTNIITLNSINYGILNANSIVNIPNPTKNLTSYTIEIGYEDSTKQYWLGLWGNTSGSTGISFYQTNATYVSYPGIGLTTNPKTEIMGGKNYITFSISEGSLKIYHNGEIYADGTNIRIVPSTANYLCFMCRKPNTHDETTQTGTDSRVAKWYYIRIYNKALTDEEILSNYNYELSLTRGE